jgi:hypothetical protein
MLMEHSYAFTNLGISRLDGAVDTLNSGQRS